MYPGPTLGADGKLRLHSDNPAMLMDGHTELAKWYYFTLENVTIGNPKVSRITLFGFSTCLSVFKCLKDENARQWKSGNTTPALKNP